MAEVFKVQMVCMWKKPKVVVVGFEYPDVVSEESNIAPCQGRAWSFFFFGGGG